MAMPVESLTTPKARLVVNPHLSGKDGGHSLHLRSFARNGVMLLRLGESPGNRELLRFPIEYDGMMYNDLSRFFGDHCYIPLAD